MSTIPRGHGDDLDLHHLQAFDVLLREHNLTRAAQILNVTQPGLSKTLARLRRYFGDPLFVRVPSGMEPTPKALELGEPVRAILERMRTLRSAHVPFDPRLSNRVFRFCVVDAGLIKLLPSLLGLLRDKAPHVRLQAIQIDTQHLESRLESGQLDFAMGSFPALVNGIHKRPLWTETYVCMVKKGHPRLGPAPSPQAFADEKHVLVSTLAIGHAHLLAERAIEAAVPPENIVCRVPMFIAAAIVAKHTDAVATLPLSIAGVLAEELGLDVIEAPIDLPKIEIAQYWHERFHRDPGHQWMRSIFAELFREAAAAPETALQPG